jgi:hypothetical protein
MPDAARVGWRTLLRRAAAVYDEPGSPLPTAARQAAGGGFGAGAEWMRLALEQHRGAPVEPRPGVNFGLLGGTKYAAAAAAAGACGLAAWWAGWPSAAVLAVPAFYAAEAQAVFLFPVALDGDPRPLRAARRLTARAGGTLRVMAVVMPLAATMLAGGFLGRGFVRSWCLGCLAVCVWYEQLRAVE